MNDIHIHTVPMLVTPQQAEKRGSSTMTRDDKNRYRREWRAANREKVNRRDREWRAEWRAANREEYNRYHREYQRERRAANRQGKK